MRNKGFPNSSPLLSSPHLLHSSPLLPLVANSGGWSLVAYFFARTYRNVRAKMRALASLAGVIA